MKTYRIMAYYNYYPGTFYAPKNGFLRDEYGEILKFTKKEDAEAYLKEMGQEYNDGLNEWRTSTIYPLSHGEAGYPFYKIFEFKGKA